MNSESADIHIHIKVRCIDGSTYDHIVHKSQTIGSLKAELAEKLSVEKERMRLIFQGHHLKDQDTVEHYKIDEGHVIHSIISSTPPAPSPEETRPEAGPSTFPGGELSILTNLMQILMQNRNRQFNFQQYSQSHTREVEFHPEDFRESLVQNLHLVDDLLKCRKEDSECPRVFDWSELRFRVGQWVDVLDTMDQWLEAQIVAVETTRVFVHYNGWGQAWDEWIPNDSPRLALFRSHTIQSPETSLHSPFPHIPADAPGVHPVSESSASTEDLLDHLVKTSSIVNSMIKDHLDLSKNPEEAKEKIKKFTAAQIAPLVDRIGRMYLDMGIYFSSLAYQDQVHGTEIQTIPRFAESGTSQIECQFGVSPNPNQISTLSHRPRAEPAILLHEIVLSPSTTLANPPAESHNVEIQTDPILPTTSKKSNEDSPKPQNTSSIWNPEEVDFLINNSNNKENIN